MKNTVIYVCIDVIMYLKNLKLIKSNRLLARRRCCRCAIRLLAGGGGPPRKNEVPVIEIDVPEEEEEEDEDDDDYDPWSDASWRENVRTMQRDKLRHMDMRRVALNFKIFKFPNSQNY